MTGLLAVGISIDAGLETAVVVAGLALLTALLGVPRWTTPHCRRCSADIKPHLVMTHASGGIVGGSVGTRCACGNILDRRGGVRWHGSRRLRALLVIALIVGSAAGGMRLWSHQRAVRGLVWHDLMPTAQLIEAIEGSRLAPSWIDPGAEHYEFARRVRLGLVTEDEIRRVLDHLTEVATGPGQPPWRLALGLLHHVPDGLRPQAAAMVVGPPGPDSAFVVEPSAIWIDPDDPTREHPFAGRGSVRSTRGPIQDSRELGLGIVIGPPATFLHAEPGHTPSPRLNALGQIFALHRIRSGERVLWSAKERISRSDVRPTLVGDDGTRLDPSTVIVPFATFPQLWLRGDEWAGAQLEIEIAVALIDGMTSHAIESAAWTHRDLTAPDSGVRWWIVRWRTAIASDMPAQRALREGQSRP